MQLFFILLLFISIILEATITTIPLVFITLFCFLIFRRNGIIFPFAFFAGLILDIVLLRVPGTTGIFYLLVLLLVSLYQRKYEIYSAPFVAVASFFGSLLFLNVFHYEQIFLQTVISTIIAVILFTVIRLLYSKKHEPMMLDSHFLPAGRQVAGKASEMTRRRGKNTLEV